MERIYLRWERGRFGYLLLHKRGAGRVERSLGWVKDWKGVSGRSGGKERGMCSYGVNLESVFYIDRVTKFNVLISISDQIDDIRPLYGSREGHSVSQVAKQLLVTQFDLCEVR